MPVKKSIKKTPSKKEIEAAAASVEAAISKLEVEEIEIETETVTLPEITEEALAADEKKSEEVEEEIQAEEKAEAPVQDATEEPIQTAGDNSEPEKEAVVDQEEEMGTVEASEITPEESIQEVVESEKEVSKPFSAAEAREGGKKSKVIIVICLCIIFTILGFFGGYMYAKTMGVTGTPATKSSDIVVEETPTPTEVEEVNLSDYSIEILNGSGVAGIAGTEQEALETDGFSVENTGNAETQDFTETQIAVKSDVSKEFIEKLRDSLSERYVVASGTEDLDDDSTYDVVVTVGSESVVDE